MNLKSISENKYLSISRTYLSNKDFDAFLEILGEKLDDIKN